MLILLAVDDHKRQIITGYGLEGILPDGKVGDIGREMVPDLRANDFDGAVTLAVSEVAQVIAADAKVTLSDDEPMAASQPARHGSGLGKVAFMIIWLVIFFGSAILRLLFGRRGTFHGGSGTWWIGAAAGLAAEAASAAALAAVVDLAGLEGAIPVAAEPVEAGRVFRLNTVSGADLHAAKGFVTWPVLCQGTTLVVP